MINVEMRDIGVEIVNSTLYIFSGIARIDKAKYIGERRVASVYGWRKILRIFTGVVFIRSATKRNYLVPVLFQQGTEFKEVSFGPAWNVVVMGPVQYGGLGQNGL